ncbi:MAG: glycosyltransferase family 39 protein [Bryobacteraceae bacterium]
MLSKRHRPLWIFPIAYAACLALLLPRLSLSLDEISDLTGVRMTNLGELIAYVRANPGAAPLAYLVQAASIHIFGFSAFAGRLPLALSSVASCIGIYILSRVARARWPLFATLVFAICPLQLRYALEARRYGLELALTVWSSVLFFQILRSRRTAVWLSLYWLCIVAGLYTLPYFIFVPLAHAASIWIAPEWRRRFALPISIAIAAGVLLFLPWYFWASAAWRATITAGGLRGRIDLRAVELILHEFGGMGYIGSGLFIVGVALALRLGKQSRAEKWFWLLYCVVPIVLALLVDATFGYFLAIRQMLPAIVPCAILFALGAEALLKRNLRYGAALAAAFAICAVWNDVRMFTRPREDWSSAAKILEAQARGGSCIVFAPADSRHLYEFFLPELGRFECVSLTAPSRAALAVSPYDVNREDNAARRKLLDAGFIKSRELNLQGPRVELYLREAARQSREP